MVLAAHEAHEAHEDQLIQALFDRLHAAHHIPIRDYCRHLMGASLEGDDLMQDVWERVWKALPRLLRAGRIDEPRGRLWLRTIALNRAREYFRRWKTRSLTTSLSKLHVAGYTSPTIEDAAMALHRESSSIGPAHTDAILAPWQDSSTPLEPDLADRAADRDEAASLASFLVRLSPLLSPQEKLCLRYRLAGYRSIEIVERFGLSRCSVKAAVWRITHKARALRAAEASTA